MISAILLAAGNSGRMGRPKALLLYKKSIFIDHILNSLNIAGCSPVITVLGGQSALILENSSVSRHIYVINKRPEDGMISSIKIGIKHLPVNTEGFLLALVDHPAVTQAVYDDIVKSASENPEQIIIPQYKKRSGHPVYIGRTFFEQLLNANADQTARDIIHLNEEFITCLDIDDPGILKDIDYPEDFQKL